MAADRRRSARSARRPASPCAERLTVHPRVLCEEPWLDPRVLPHVRRWPTRGRAGPGRRAAAGAALAGARRRLRVRPAAPTCTPPSTPPAGATDRRSDFEDVYGDWSRCRRDQRPRRRRGGPPRAATCGPRSAAAERDPAGLSDAHALALMTAAEGPALEAVCALADDLRRDAVGDDVTYVVNRNINFTNVCYTGCRFCAFAQRKTDADAYTLSLDEIGRPGRGGWSRSARPRSACRAASIPTCPGTAYFDIAAKVKRGRARPARARLQPDGGDERRRPHRPVGAWTSWSAPRSPASTRCPGRPRRSSTTTSAGCSPRASCRPRQWVEVVTTAHSVGLPTTSTMMYGHVDHPGHWVAHLRMLARIQAETGGFTEFVPLPFVHHVLADLPGRRGPPRPDRARQPGRARGGPDHAARPDRQHPVLAG